MIGFFTGERAADLLEAEAPRELGHDRRSKRRREVDLLRGDRIAVGVGARHIAGLGKRDQRMAQDKRQRVSADDIGDFRLGLIGAEGQLRGELGIPRKDLREIGVGGTELGDELEIAAAAILDRLRY